MPNAGQTYISSHSACVSAWQPLWSAYFPKYKKRSQAPVNDVIKSKTNIFHFCYRFTSLGKRATLESFVPRSILIRSKKRKLPKQQQQQQHHETRY